MLYRNLNLVVISRSESITAFSAAAGKFAKSQPFMSCSEETQAGLAALAGVGDRSGLCIRATADRGRILISRCRQKPKVGAERRLSAETRAVRREGRHCWSNRDVQPSTPLFISVGTGEDAQ